MVPAVGIDAKGQFKDRPFNVDLKINLPEQLYEVMISRVSSAPTILASLGQSYAGK